MNSVESRRTRHAQPNKPTKAAARPRRLARAHKGVEQGGKPMRSTRFAAICLLAALVSRGAAAADDGPVKLGVITDMSGVLSAVAGPASAEAVKLAIEDFGGSVLGKPI